MSAEDRMSIDERRKYLRRMHKRYRKASREEKSELLDEMEAVTELYRKSLIRLMRGDLARKPRRRQREATYRAEVRAAVRLIVESLDWVCAERLQPNLVWMAEHLAAHGDLGVPPALLDRSRAVSISTVRRILERGTRSQVSVMMASEKGR